VPAVQSYTSEAAPDGKRGLSFGILVSSGYIGAVPSPLIGGVIVESYGFAALFLIAFSLYSLSTVMVLMIPKLPGDSYDMEANASSDTCAPQKIDEMEKTDREEARRITLGDRSSSEVKQGILRRLAPMLALSCFFMGSVYVGWSYIPLYLRQNYEFSYPQVQLMYTVSNLSSVVIVNGLGKLSDRYSPANKLALVTIPIVSLILGYWIMIHTSDVGALSVSFVLLGSIGSVFPLIYSTIGELCGERRLGRTYGVIGMFIYAAEATTPYLGGSLFAVSGNLPFMLTLALSPLLFVAVYIAHIKTH
jgi:MFS family permease